MWKRIDSKSIIHFCLLYVAQILLDGPDQTLSLVGSGRVVPRFHHADPTRPDPPTAWVSDKSADFVWS